jgi:RNA 3'-terminal phosphate cyclase
MREGVNMTEKESTAGMIGIFTPNPHDITTEEAEGLAKLFRSACPDYEVQATGKEREGYGVTLFEVVRISITGGAAFGVGKMVAEELAKKLTDIAVDWVRDRFRGRKKDSKRPVYVAIYGRTGPSNPR